MSDCHHSCTIIAGNCLRPVSNLVKDPAEQSNFETALMLRNLRALLEQYTSSSRGGHLVAKDASKVLAGKACRVPVTLMLCDEGPHDAV